MSSAGTGAGSTTRRDLTLLVAGSALLFGLRLGARDLWNPNEPIYGEAVAEMARRGAWLIPYVNDLVFAEKPILFYWIALAASKLLGGVSEAAVRAPSFLAGIAVVLGTYVLVLPYAGRVRALSSAIACATLYGVFWNARFAQMDLLVTATTLWCLVAVTRTLDHGMPAARGWMLAGLAAGLGFAAKGPVAWICPGLVVAAYVVATGRARAAMRWEVLAGAATCVLVASPWYVLLWRQGRTDVLHEVLIRQNFQRFTNPWDHAAPWWYYLEYFWIDMAPWAFFVPLALWHHRRTEGERRLAWLSGLWIAAIVAFFSFSRSKRSPYILPIAPAVAVAAAEVAVAYAQGALSRAGRRIAIAIASAWTVVLGAAGLALATVGAARYPGLALEAYVLAAAAGAAALCGGVVLARAAWRRGLALPIALAGGMAVFFAGSAIALPGLNVFKSARPVAAEIERLAGRDGVPVSFGLWNWRAEYAFYLGRPLRNLTSEAALRAAWEGEERLVLLVEGERLAEALRVVGGREPAFRREVGGRTVYLFTNR